MSRIRKGTQAGALALLVVSGFEGLRTTAYRDVVGIPTICYGETRGMKMGMTATKAQCDDMLMPRLQEFEAGVLKCIKVPLNDNQLVAHVSLAYNIGTAAHCKSSAVRLFNAGYPAAGCDAFMKWNKAGGVTFPGLTRRRAFERDLCKRAA